jgi:hypothetical protein
MAPQTRGAQKVYDIGLKPLLLQHQDKIQKFIKDVQGASSSLAKEGMRAASDKIKDPNTLLNAANVATKFQTAAENISKD